MFAIHTYNMEHIMNFAAAERHFNDTKKPRTTKWLDHQRPLRNTASRHLRLEKGHYNGIDCYDLVLYSTPLVRYFRPNEKGEYAVWLQNYYTQSSSKFLGAARWWNRKTIKRDDGKTFELQLSAQSSVAREVWGDDFTVKLVFNANNEVMVEKSAHVPFTRRVSSTNQRARRKEFLSSLSTIFDMLEMQYQSFVGDVMIDDDHGRPFGQKDWEFNFSSRELLAPRLAAHGVSGLTPDEVTQLVRCMTNQCHANARYIVNKRAYDYQIPRNIEWHEQLKMRERLEVPCNREMLHHHSAEVQERLTPTWADLRKAIKRDLLAFVKLDKGEEFRPLAQLAETYPQVVYSVKVEAWQDLSNVLGIEDYRKLVGRKGVVY